LEMSGFPFTSGVEGVRYITTPDIFYLQNTDIIILRLQGKE